MSARMTRAGQAPPYFPPLHEGVDAKRLHGHEAGPTERFWVGVSGDSVHVPRGTVRSVVNRADRVARLLVVIARPGPAS